MADLDPTLSILVTVVEGGDYVRDFLLALAAFDDPPPLDVIVPWDDSLPEVGRLAATFPQVRFLPLGRVATRHPAHTPAGQHELYDRRRAAGLAVATGDIVAILEDRGRPRPDWARKAVDLHARLGKAVIGGAIDCEEPSHLLNWAFWVTDFGRYGRPFRSGPRDWVSDVNLTYARRALDATRHLWKDRYHEPVVHWYLMKQGEELWLSDELIVDHRRPPLRLGPLLRERFGWGRLFGEIRVREMPAMRRLALIAASPLIPPVLWLRHYRMQRAKGRGGRYLRALPYVMVLTTAWTLGEAWGYVTRRA